MNRKETASPKLENLTKEFEKHFGNTDKTVKIKSPASLTLLGDHTHYNDGLLIAAALNKYTYIMMRKIEGDSFNLIFNGKKIPLKNLSEEPPKKGTNYTSTIIKRIFQTLLFRNLISGGVECVIESEIPPSIGLGYYSSLQIGLFKAAKKVFRFKLTDYEIIDLAHEIEKEFIGQISNKANYFASTFGKENCLMLVDLRVNEHKCLKFNNENYSFILCDTNLTIKNSESICRTRIEECSVGVKGLRLYIWGIKNLRDVDLKFLNKHVNMLPNLVYKRCVYNVNEKQRVQNAATAIRAKKHDEFAKQIYDSFNSIVNDYELNYSELNYLVSTAKNIEGVVAAKSISCTTAKCTYVIAETPKIKSVVNKISKAYNEKHKKDLSTFVFSTAKGVHTLD